MELVARLPLLPISNKEEHTAAKEMILLLTRLDGDLSPAEVGYGKVLVQLVQNYERGLVGDFFHNISGNEVLESLLQAHGLKQTEVAEIADISKQNLNDFLKGRRALTKDARLKLAKHFKVEIAVFDLVRDLTLA